MKPMKKAISLLLAVLFITAMFTGCGAKDTDDETYADDDIEITSLSDDDSEKEKTSAYRYSKPDIYEYTDFDEPVVDFYDDYLFLTKDALYLYDFLDFSYRKYELSYTPEKILFFDGNSSTTGKLLIENTDGSWTSMKVSWLDNVSSLSDTWSEHKVAFEGIKLESQGQFISLLDINGLRYIFYRDNEIHSIILDEDTLEIADDTIVKTYTKYSLLTDEIKSLPRTAFSISNLYPSLITVDNAYYHCNGAVSTYWIEEIEQDVDEVFVSYDHVSDGCPVFTKISDSTSIYKTELGDNLTEFILTYKLSDGYTKENIKNVYYNMHSDIYVEFDDGTFYSGTHEGSSTEPEQTMVKKEALSQLSQDNVIQRISFMDGHIAVLLDDGVVYKLDYVK